MQLLLISITACKRQPEANKGCVAQIINLKPEDRKPHAECNSAISPPLVVHETAAKDKLLRLPITQDRNWNGEHDQITDECMRLFYASKRLRAWRK